MIGKIFNDMKVSIKLTGSLTLIFMIVTGMLLTGASVRMKALRALDTVYRQYVGDIRETGDMKIGLEKIEKNLYRYIAVSSGSNKTQENLKQEIDAVNRMIQTYRGKKLSSDEEKILTEFEAAWPEAQRPRRWARPATT